MSSSMGMLDPAYFVGRVALLSWLNDLLALSYSKVEECANGAAYCQIIHSLHPNVVPLKRVDFTARAQYAMVANYKVLQAAFTKLSIDRHIDVEKLIRGKYQDNLEFLQWLKGYYSTTGPEGGVPGYDPVAARGRAGAPTPRAVPGGRPAPGRPGVAGTRPVPGTRPAPGSRSTRGASTDVGRPVATPRVRMTTPKPPVPRHTVSAAGGASAGVSSVAGLRAEVAAAKADSAAATEKVDTLEGVVRELAADRDFYFGKLRAVEELLKALPEGGPEGEAALAASVLDILYAADDAGAPGMGGEADVDGEAPDGGEHLAGVEAALGGAAGTPAGAAGGAYPDDGHQVEGEAVPAGGDGTPTGELLGEEEELDEQGAYGEVPEGAAARSPTSELFTADVADEELLTAS